MSTATPADQRHVALSRRLRETSTYVRAVTALVLVWGFGDVASTLLAAAATSTPTRELNPLVGFLLQIDPLLVVLLKAIVVGTAAAALLASRDVVEGLPGWRAWFATMVAVGSLVVGNNLLVAVDALG